MNIDCIEHQLIAILTMNAKPNHIDVVPRIVDTRISATYSRPKPPVRPVQKGGSHNQHDSDSDSESDNGSVQSVATAVSVVAPSASKWSTALKYLLPVIFVICVIVVIYIAYKYWKGRSENVAKKPSLPALEGGAADAAASAIAKEEASKFIMDDISLSSDVEEDLPPLETDEEDEGDDGDDEEEDDEEEEEEDEEEDDEEDDEDEDDEVDEEIDTDDMVSGGPIDVNLINSLLSDANVIGLPDTPPPMESFSNPLNTIDEDEETKETKENDEDANLFNIPTPPPPRQSKSKTKKRVKINL